MSSGAYPYGYFTIPCLLVFLKPLEKDLQGFLKLCEGFCIIELDLQQNGKKRISVLMNPRLTAVLSELSVTTCRDISTCR